MFRSTINVRGKIINLSSPKVMGILNVTPDSFYGKSRVKDIDSIINQVSQMLNDGMDIIDIGGYSSRPGAKHIIESEEIKRTVIIIKKINNVFPDLPISIDTFRAKVAEKAIEAGAGIINDISAGELDDKMFETVASLQVPYIAMHMKGTPDNMQANPVYENVTTEVLQYFSEKLNRLSQLNINDVIVDPGFGFGKTIEHNYELLDKLELFNTINRPILVGVSRKSMINKVLGTSPENALNGTTVLNTIALTKGANILRVHDVKEAVETVKLYSMCDC